MDGLRGTIASSLGSPNGPPPLTPISQARQCQLCLVTLANANLLRRHVEDHHFHIRKYDCVHCGKKFKRKEHRERHERIHTGEKPFVCHICNARFTQKEHLKGHVENVHHKHASSLVSSAGLSTSTSLANDLNMNQFTALYAPVTRKTVNSPNKHMQTITINFN
ncbi:hypothetical protein C7M84_008458 [Penaeus vannamei]|uniref:C2H2-type domain-containing protein n=1 Tax=Penaeus vannamei TaxID=6689 RepID=A0A423T9R7_PENVA|nr:hypothetical protein C7M84_008458 [Penaeus vannamei]